MSYILEALRRAEVERQRGAVPGLHSQPVAAALSAGPGSGAAAQRAWRPATWALAGLLLAALLAAAGGLGWLLKPPGAVLAVATLPVLAPPAARSLAPALPPQAVGLAGAGLAALPRVAPAEPAPAPARLAPAAASAVAVARLPPPRRAPAAPAPRPIIEPAAAAAQPPPVAAATAAAAQPPAPVAAGLASAPARLPTLAELPDALRREVQPLNLGGAVYADKAALRIVIVNGQVFHEGDKPFPALQVQQIRPRSVVFSVRGQPFEMPL